MSPGSIILCSALLAQLAAQIMKMGFRSLRAGSVQWGSIGRDGDMPSAHSATVAAITLGAYLVEGFSPLFTVALVFALITIVDALHIRQEVGRHAQFLNSLHPSPHFKENTGHSLIQVVVGVFVGCGAAIICYYGLRE